MPKSTVSRKLAQLERRLGVALLKRTTRSLKLSELGSQYYEQCASLVVALEEAERGLSEQKAEARGLLRITAAVEFGMHPLRGWIEEYLKLYPEVSVELLLTERLVDLVSEGFDLGVRVGVLKDSSFRARRIGTADVQLFASPEYLKRRGSPAEPEELKNHDCLLFTAASGAKLWLLRGPRGRTYKHLARGRILANNMSLLKDLAVSGQGIALLHPFLCGEELKKGTLRHVLKAWKGGGAPIHLIYPEQSFLPLKLRSFVDFVSERARSSRW
jgi:DNA-binding transcriptional LysR family regulator